MSKSLFPNDEDANEADRSQNQNQCCRICYSSSLNLISTPCRCSGSVGYVHRRCLRRWIQSVPRNLDTCEICHQRYEGIIRNRNFKKLFTAFFRRPFLALFKFSVDAGMAAGMAYILSTKLPVILKDLSVFDINDGTSSTATEILIPLLIASPFIVIYCYSIESAAESFREFVHATSDWWNYSDLTVQMSGQSLDGSDNLSRPHSATEEFSLEGLTLFPLM